MLTSRIKRLALAGILGFSSGCFPEKQDYKIPVVYGEEKIDYKEEIIEEIIENYGFSKSMLALEYSYRKHNGLEGFFHRNDINKIYSDLEKFISTIAEKTNKKKFEKDYEIIEFITEKVREKYDYQRSVTFSQGLAEKKLDCNLYCYLIYDIVKKCRKDLDVKFTISPNHVFLMFKTKDKENPLIFKDGHYYFDPTKLLFYNENDVEYFKQTISSENNSFYLRPLTIKEAYATMLFEVSATIFWDYNKHLSKNHQINCDQLYSSVYLSYLANRLFPCPEHQKLKEKISTHIKDAKKFFDGLGVG